MMVRDEEWDMRNEEDDWWCFQEEMRIGDNEAEDELGRDAFSLAVLRRLNG